MSFHFPLGRKTQLSGRMVKEKVARRGVSVETHVKRAWAYPMGIFLPQIPKPLKLNKFLNSGLKLADVVLVEIWDSYATKPLMCSLRLNYVALVLLLRVGGWWWYRTCVKYGREKW